MIYTNIAEYEPGDSMLARQTILDLHKEIERLNNFINTMLGSNFFIGMCPLEFCYLGECDEGKAQEVFYEDDYCKKNCNDDFKECWLKFFKRLQELKGSDKE